ncbi:MAG: transporter [Alistipes senegalensis]|nr:transporter [Bacteroides cellulosilyticus]MCM1352669.1 transporter [Alistipes senegalensis]
MKIKNWLTGCCALCFAAVSSHVQAQSDYRFGGLAFNRDLMMAWDFSSLSRPQTFGTARSMGMGGAFVSLGADLASMSLNPAGLGMYRHNEFSITPLVSLSRAATSSVAGAQAWAGDHKNRFALADVGLAFNLFERANGALTSMTLGFGLNRVADFNTRYSFSSDVRYNGAMVPSIADVFAQQMNQGGVFPEPKSEVDPNGRLDYRNPYFWPAVLAYKSAMTHVVPGAGDSSVWEADAIGPRASILRSVDAVESGSINEFALSLGANLNNVVYLGASLGIQTVRKTSTLVYGEDYGYFADGDDGYAYGPGGVLPAQLEYADLWQRTVIDGAGVNFKLGVIVRPVAGLRLGAAVHTPTFYSLDRSYRAGMDYRLLSNVEGVPGDEARLESPTQYDEAGDSWDFVSPTRLMFGASYAFGKFAIVSVDYERDWYNGIRVKNVPTGADFGPTAYKADFKLNFCATNNLRAGIELRPLPIFALRAGYGYSSSMLKDESLAYEVPQLTDSHYFTLGAGVNLSRTVSLDVAYQHLTDHQSEYRLFYSYDRTTDAFSYSSDLYKTSFTRHFIAFTLGVHF